MLKILATTIISVVIFSSFSFNTKLSNSYLSEVSNVNTSNPCSESDISTQKVFKIDNNLNLLYRRCSQDYQGARFNKINIALTPANESIKQNDFSEVKVDILLASDQLNYSKIPTQYRNKVTDKRTGSDNALFSALLPYENLEQNPNIISLTKHNILNKDTDTVAWKTINYGLNQSDLTLYLGRDFTSNFEYKYKAGDYKINKKKIQVADFNINENEYLISNYSATIDDSKYKDNGTIDFSVDLTIDNTKNNATWSTFVSYLKEIELKVDLVFVRPIERETVITATHTINGAISQTIGDFSGATNQKITFDRANIGINEAIDANAEIKDKDKLKEELKEGKTKISLGRTYMSFVPKSSDDKFNFVINEDKKFDTSKFSINEGYANILLKGQKDSKELDIAHFSRINNYSSEKAKRTISLKVKIKDKTLNFEQELLKNFATFKLNLNKDNAANNFTINDIKSLEISFIINANVYKTYLTNSSEILDSDITIIPPSDVRSSNTAIIVISVVISILLLLLLIGAFLIIKNWRIIMPKKI